LQTASQQDSVMSWTTIRKHLGTSQLVAHSSHTAGVIGRAPATLTMTFSPLELFGAAARCSHLHLVNPAIVTPESLMIARLIEPHVDNSSNDFAILATADLFKDFVKSYFAGTVAAGLAYLAMVTNGYIWSDHFEHVGGGRPTRGKKPDFVFSGVGTGLALMEAKGSRSGTLRTFDTKVSRGYTDQVEPHLGHLVGGAIARHGYSVGAWLQSTTKAELRIHHTAAPAVPQGSGGGAAGNIVSIQRHNFATAFALAHGPTLGNAIRAGQSIYPSIPFLRFSWLGKEWVTGLGLNLRNPRFSEGLWWLEFFLPDEWPRLSPGRKFAIEETRAKIALLRFLNGDRAGPIDAPELTPMEDDLRLAARRGDDGAERGAVFPDGLALVDLSGIQAKFEPVAWDVQRSVFH
jgi:hypothetical protein